MIERLRQKVAQGTETRRRRKRRWEVREEGGVFLLTRPHLYVDGKRWPDWGLLQTRVLQGLMESWPHPFPYIRFCTTQEWATHMPKPCQYVECGSDEKHFRVLLFPDCRDAEVWKSVLGVGNFFPAGRMLLVLDHNPSDWQAVVAHLHEIAARIAGGEPAGKFAAEFAGCHCVCYSEDEDLVIAKIDLAETALFSILEEEARKDGLELVVEHAG